MSDVIEGLPERIRLKIEAKAKQLAKGQPNKFFKTVVDLMDEVDQLTWVQERHVSEEGSYLHVSYETATKIFTLNLLVSGRNVKPEGWTVAAKVA